MQDHQQSLTTCQRIIVIISCLRLLVRVSRLKASAGLIETHKDIQANLRFYTERDEYAFEQECKVKKDLSQ